MDSAQRNPAPRHIPALDGLRGVAILLVVTYHAARILPYVGPREEVLQRVLDTGWIGVDLFFVLSGFLITGILLDTKGSAAYFRTFYARRMLRIVPLYFVFLLCIAAAAWIAYALGFGQEQADQSLRVQPWYWTYMVNVLIAREGWAASGRHTAHLWSLSIEEQFYLAWPVIVFAISRRALIRTAIGVAVGALALRVALVAMHAPWAAVYVLLPTRVDTLAIGALLAVLAREPNAWSRVRAWALPAAVAAALVCAALFRREGLARSGEFTQTIGYSALAVFSGAALVSAIAAPAGSAQSWIWNHQLLRFFGRYSYGLYVWHPMVIALFRERVLPAERLPLVYGSHLPANLLFTVLAILASVAAALVSWRAVEQPFLATKRLVPYRQTRAAGFSTAPAVVNRRSMAGAVPETARPEWSYSRCALRAARQNVAGNE
jgi:peptidoglycan/LPS O-acetylase OafA/YrhL